MISRETVLRNHPWVENLALERESLAHQTGSGTEKELNCVNTEYGWTKHAKSTHLKMRAFHAKSEFLLCYKWPVLGCGMRLHPKPSLEANCKN